MSPRGIVYAPTSIIVSLGILLLSQSCLIFLAVSSSNVTHPSFFILILAIGYFTYFSFFIVIPLNLIVPPLLIKKSWRVRYKTLFPPVCFGSVVNEQQNFGQKSIKLFRFPFKGGVLFLYLLWVFVPKF